MDLQKKPRAKQAVLMTCIGALCATLLLVLLTAGGMTLLVNRQNEKNMKLSFWDSTFIVEAAFRDPNGNVSLVINEISRSDDHVADEVIELKALLPVRDMPLTVQSGDKQYTYAEMLQSSDCGLIEGSIITSYTLYLPDAAQDLILTINNKSIKLTVAQAEDLKPVTTVIDTAVGPFTMSTYYLGGNMCAVWCEMDTDLQLTALGIENVKIRYTSDIIHRDIAVDMPVSNNASLKLIGLMGNKPGYQKKAKVANTFSYEGIYFETEVNISKPVGSIVGDSTKEISVVLDETMGLKANMLARRSKQVLCYFDTQTAYGTFSGGSGYLLPEGQTPTAYQLANRASTGTDLVVVSGTSSNGEEPLQLHLTTARFTVEKLSTSIPFAEAK